jgi:hypothetical protein
MCYREVCRADKTIVDLFIPFFLSSRPGLGFSLAWLG